MCVQGIGENNNYLMYVHMQASTQLFTAQSGAVWLDYPVSLTTLNYSKPESLHFTTQLLFTAIVHFFLLKRYFVSRAQLNSLQTS